MAPEEGWVTDERVLHTLFMVRLLEVGDQLHFVAGDENKPIGPYIGTILDSVSLTYVHKEYNNLRLTGSGGVWRVTGWRRPKKVG